MSITGIGALTGATGAAGLYGSTGAAGLYGGTGASGTGIGTAGIGSTGVAGVSGVTPAGGLDPTAEATAAAYRHFDMADANRDGQITRDERMQMRQRMRAERQPG